MSNQVYNFITDRIIEQMDKGIIPWKQPWARMDDYPGSPRNLVSKKAYHGMNVLLLGMTGYENPFWLTQNQLRSMNNKPVDEYDYTPVIFYTMVEDKELDENGKKKHRPILRYYKLFNVEQADKKIVIPEIKEPEPVCEFTPLERAEDLLQSIPDPCPVTFGGGRAFYSPRKNFIRVPEKNLFDSTEFFYATLFHEISHSTGHKSKLNREIINHFGTKKYAKEELTAEMSSNFIMNELGIVTEDTENNTVAYLQNWKQKLRDDPSIMIQAAGKAQKVCDYLFNRKKEYNNV